MVVNLTEDDWSKKLFPLKNSRREAFLKETAHGKSGAANGNSKDNPAWATNRNNKNSSNYRMRGK